jgi:hypothetical protein
MGQGTPGVVEPEMIEREIAGIRGTMGGVLRELDHRRHELLDWRLQLRRHGVALAVGAAALALVIVGWAVTRRRVQARRPRRPEEPSAAKKIVTAALASAASVAAKSGMSRFIAAARGNET